MGCGCGPRWPLHLNTHGDSGEYHSGHKWYLRPMTSDVAPYFRLRRGRSVIWIVAPGASPYATPPPVSPGGLKVPGQVPARSSAGHVQVRC